MPAMRAVASTSPFGVSPRASRARRLGPHAHARRRHGAPPRRRLLGDVHHVHVAARPEVRRELARFVGGRIFISGFVGHDERLECHVKMLGIAALWRAPERVHEGEAAQAGQRGPRRRIDRLPRRRRFVPCPRAALRGSGPGRPSSAPRRDERDERSPRPPRRRRRRSPPRRRSPRAPRARASASLRARASGPRDRARGAPRAGRDRDRGRSLRREKRSSRRCGSYRSVSRRWRASTPRRPSPRCSPSKPCRRASSSRPRRSARRSRRRSPARAERAASTPSSVARQGRSMPVDETRSRSQVSQYVSLVPVMKPDAERRVARARGRTSPGRARARRRRPRSASRWAASARPHLGGGHEVLGRRASRPRRSA